MFTCFDGGLFRMSTLTPDVRREVLPETRRSLTHKFSSMIATAKDFTGKVGQENQYGLIL